MQDVFKEIKGAYEYLSRVEKALANIILESPEKFINCSMARLSEELGISQGSINNFSKKFSSGGFSALKLKVAQSLPVLKKESFTAVSFGESAKSAMETRIKDTLAAFENTLSLNSEESLKSAAEKIMNAKKIDIYGIFGSAIVAKDLCLRLIQLSIPATYVDDVLMCAVSASMLQEGSLVIAVSCSGATKDIIDAVKIAKKNGVSTLAITAGSFSPLSKLCDNTLMSAPSGKSVSDRADEVRLSQLLIVDTLCSYIRSRQQDLGEKHYYKLSDILNLHSIDD